MKTKLSFLALPFCLGVVLTFVIAACSSSDSNPDPGPGGNSAGNSPGISSAVESGSVELNGFDVVDGSEYGKPDKVLILGKFDRIGRETYIKKLDLGPHGLVTYDGSLVNSQITLPPETEYVTLTNNAFIDLKTVKECKKIDIEVKACVDDACSAGNFAGDTKPFTIPAKYCASSSSATVPSSSSATRVWVFGDPTTKNIEALDEVVEVGSGITFKLTEDPAAPDLEVLGGGKIRMAMTGPDKIVPGTAYNAYNERTDAEELGDKIPTASKLSESSPDNLAVQATDYYFIYAGNDKYLLQFSKCASCERFSKWPKVCTIWKATKWPENP